MSLGDVLALLGCPPPTPAILYSSLGFYPPTPFKGGYELVGCAHSHSSPTARMGWADLARAGLTVGRGRGEIEKPGIGEDGGAASDGKIVILALGYAPTGADGLALFSGSAYPRSL